MISLKDTNENTLEKENIREYTRIPLRNDLTTKPTVKPVRSMIPESSGMQTCVPKV